MVPLFIINQNCEDKDGEFTLTPYYNGVISGPPVFIDFDYFTQTYTIKTSDPTVVLGNTTLALYGELTTG